MAYVDEFNVNTPSGASDISEGDDRIRELKRALDERLRTVLIGWPDLDPLQLRSEQLDVAEELTLIRYGPEDGVTADGEHDFYFAVDTKKLFVRDGNRLEPIASNALMTRHPFGTPRARLGLTASKDVPRAVWSNIAWDVADINEGGMYDLAGDRTLMSVPPNQGGLYMLYGYCMTIATPDNEINFAFASGNDRFAVASVSNAGSIGMGHCHLLWIGHLEEGAQFRLQMYQDIAESSALQLGSYVMAMRLL